MFFGLALLVFLVPPVISLVPGTLRFCLRVNGNGPTPEMDVWAKAASLYNNAHRLRAPRFPSRGPADAVK
jgi:hypothetical protein